MNTTPRTLNRVLLALVGVVLLAAGTVTLALATMPSAGPWWRTTTTNIQDQVGGLFARTTLEGQRDSWLWIVVAIVTVLLLVGMVAWAVNQGKGRTSAFAGDFGGDRDGGRVLINASVPEQALKAALAERTDLVSSAVSTYELPGHRRPGLKIRVQPRPGVPPYVLAEDISRLVAALDRVVGCTTPVLISIGTGARTRFVRPERVR